MRKAVTLTRSRNAILNSKSAAELQSANGCPNLKPRSNSESGSGLTTTVSKDQGICVKCRYYPARAGKTTCQECMANMSIQGQRRYRYRKNNLLCARCNNPPVENRTLCIDCLNMVRIKKNTERWIRRIINDIPGQPKECLSCGGEIVDTEYPSTPSKCGNCAEGSRRAKRAWLIRRAAAVR